MADCERGEQVVAEAPPRNAPADDPPLPERDLRTETAELRRVERELRESRRMLRLVLDTIPLAVFWKDTNSVFLGCNQTCAEAAGKSSPEELVGKTDYDMAWRKEESDFFRRVDRRVMERNEPELRIIEPQRQGDGKEAWLETNKVPLHDAEGKVVGILGTFQDITEQRLLETRLNRAEKLESLGLMAAGVAHDINNYLTTIFGNAFLLAEELPEDSEARARLEEIERATEGAAELTRQMLTFAGSEPSRRRRIQLGELLRETAQLVRASIADGIEIETTVEPSPEVEADAGQLRQVLMNLVLNAGEAIDDGPGTISLRCGTVSADREVLRETYLDDQALPEGTYVYFEVEDDGMGMDEETRSRLFDPFFTTKTKGRGLGMSSVLGIVRGHRGTIQVTTRPGHGSCFRVLLPAAKTADADADI